MRINRALHPAAWEIRLARSPLPLMPALFWLEWLVARWPAPAGLAEWGQRHAGVESARAEAWSRRARWGLHAGEFLLHRLNDPRRREATLAAVREPDWQPLHQALASGGVVIAAAHVGPPKLQVHMLAKRIQPLLAWSGTDRLDPALLGAGVKVSDPVRTPNKAVLLLEALGHLRRGGALLGAPDIATGVRQQAIWHHDWEWRFSLGLPALIRRLRVPTFMIAGLWQGRRPTMKLWQLNNPDFAWEEDRWNRAWLETYWAQIKPSMFGDAANLRALRSIRRGALKREVRQ